MRKILLIFSFIFMMFVVRDEEGNEIRRVDIGIGNKSICPQKSDTIVLTKTDIVSTPNIDCNMDKSKTVEELNP